jgi:hypothetical protein
MPDMEKVIEGLKYCTITDGIECPNCPYRHEDDCIEMLTADAIALLEEQQNRIETLESLREIELEGR